MTRLRPVVRWSDRLRTGRTLSRCDRRSAALAQAHGTMSVLAGAQLAVSVAWGAGGECSVCARAAAHGDGDRGVCVVGGLYLAAGHHRAALDRAVDTVWRTLHCHGARPVQWNAPTTRSLLQIAELRSWNDRAGRSSDDVLALLRAAHTTTASTYRRLQGTDCFERRPAVRL